MTFVDRLGSRLVDGDLDDGDLAEAARGEVPGNAARLVGGLALQQTGDRIVDPKTVLAWLLASVGAPAAMTGLLVPVRESGSLLPQASLLPLVRRAARRKWIWVAGGVGQAAAVAGMAVAAATLTGGAAGAAVLGALAVFALARSLSSIAAKDVKGRTIPKGQRGMVTGWATVASGVVAITVGLALQRLGGEDLARSVFVALLAGGAVLWLAASGVFATVREAAGEHDEEGRPGSVRAAVARVRDDRAFRRFVLARGLLLVSALSPPFVVQIATREVGPGVEGLGPFLVASGLASLLGGRLWGQAADRSSRRVMIAAAGLSSAVIGVLLAALAVGAVRGSLWLYAGTYLALALVHTGTRVGRSTYVVDLAEGDRRTEYVAVSNTIMGVLLLVTGALTAALAVLGPEVALAALALLGVAGVVVARGLPEVSAG
jgi:hypothetical protein